MSLIQIHKIAERIPEFECIPGCTDCCGPVPFARSEQEAIPEAQRKAHADVDTVAFLRDVLDRLYQGKTHRCEYAVEGQGCSIYAHRPIMCRLFGTVEDLQCPHGKRPARLLAPMQGKTILRKYLHVRHHR